MVTALLTASALPLFSCGGEMEDEASQDALAPGSWRLQNYETSFARRCVVSAGVAGGQVGAAICNGLAESQGYTFDATTTKRNWLKSQTTGAAKCLAATAAGTVVNAVCTGERGEPAVDARVHLWHRAGDLLQRRKVPHDGQRRGALCRRLRHRISQAGVAARLGSNAV
jgi:hypothetical protein